ncbi:MAG: hypothetical protein WC792_06235 [Candidatus Micrarchaeia archaeon]
MAAISRPGGLRARTLPGNKSLRGNIEAYFSNGRAGSGYQVVASINPHNSALMPDMPKPTKRNIVVAKNGKVILTIGLAPTPSERMIGRENRSSNKSLMPVVRVHDETVMPQAHEIATLVAKAIESQRLPEVIKHITNRSLHVENAGKTHWIE